MKWFDMVWFAAKYGNCGDLESSDNSTWWKTRIHMCFLRKLRINTWPTESTPSTSVTPLSGTLPRTSFLRCSTNASCSSGSTEVLEDSRIDTMVYMMFHTPWRIHGAGIYIYANMTGVYGWLIINVAINIACMDPMGTCWYWYMYIYIYVLILVEVTDEALFRSIW